MGKVFFMVCPPRFELGTSCSRSKRAAKLRYGQVFHQHYLLYYFLAYLSIKKEKEKNIDRG